MNRIKIGQIGIGHNHAASKISALRALPEIFEVIGVVESNPVWRSRRGGMKQYENLPWLTEEELFNTPGLDAVIVETDIPELISAAWKCVDNNLHIHMDKPPCAELESFAALLLECRRKKLGIQLGYMYRYNPAVRFCLDAVSNGWLGEIFEVHAVMSRKCNDDYRKWLVNFKGGAMFIFAGHLIDIIITILGRPERTTPFLRSTLKDGLVDNGLAVLEYPSASASVRCSVVEIDGIKHRRLIVCGTGGSVEICPLEVPSDRYALDPLHLRLTLADAKGKYAAGTHYINVGVMGGRYTEQLKDFARIIRQEITNPYTYDHEYLVHESLLHASGY